MRHEGPRPFKPAPMRTIILYRNFPLFLYRKLPQYPVGHTLYSIHADYSQGWMGVEGGPRPSSSARGAVGKIWGKDRVCARRV